MRIETKGKWDWRLEEYEAVAEALGEANKSRGLDAATEAVLKLVGRPGPARRGALDDVSELLEDDRVPDDVAEEIAEALSVGPITLTYERARSGVEVEGAQD